MKQKLMRVCGPLALLVFASACGESPLQPSSTTSGVSTSGVTTSSSSVAPLVSPGDGAQVAYASQPITLTIGNAVSTSPNGGTYTFEVATDAAFANIVFTKAGVAQGAGGKTSVLVETKLKASTAHFWRARLVSGDDNGPTAKARTFQVGAEVVIQVPVPLSPAQNGKATGTANLTVSNSQRTGPAGPISYRFDVSDSSSFGRIVYSTVVSEQGGQTTAAVSAALTNGATYFWRAQALDPQSFITTAFSPAFAFQFVSFDMKTAVIWNNPSDLGSWAETAAITSIDFTSDAMLVDFDKRLGGGRWPDVGFGDGSLEYTLGMCLFIDGQWHCSAVVQFWHGRELEASGRPDEVGINWFYDQRWGRMIGHQPAFGETIGMFVGAGNLRDSGNVIVKERSNVVLLPFGGTYRPGLGASLASGPRSLIRR